MKTFHFIIILFIATVCEGQDSCLIQETDVAVQHIEKRSIQIEKFRWLLGYIDYGTIDGTISKIVYSHKAGPRQILESFYLKDSFIVFATKQATSYYFYGDSTVLLGKYYLQKNILKCYNVFNGEKYNTLALTQKDILIHFNKAKSIIERHRTKNNGTQH